MNNDNGNGAALAERRRYIMRSLSLWVLVILLAIGAVYCFILCGKGVYDTSDRWYGGTLTPVSGWRVYKDGVETDVVLPTRVDAECGEQIVIGTILPDVLPDSPALLFLTEMQDVTVRVDGRVIYEWNNADSRPFGKASPPTANTVALEASDAGKSVTVTLSSPYRATSGALPAVSVGNITEIGEYRVVSGLPGYVCCLGAILLGLMMYIMMFFISINSTAMSPLRDICLFTVFIALYLLCMIDMPQMLLLNDYLKVNLGYLMFFLFPIPFMSYLYERSCGMPRRIYGVSFWLYVSIFIMAVIFQLTGVADLYESASVTRALTASMMLYSLGNYIYAAIQKRTVYSVCELAGIAALYAAGVAETVAVYRGTLLARGTCLMLGLAIFLICIVITVSVEAVSVSRERARLKHEIERQKLLMMSSQMRPHFLYNALQAIQEMCYDDPKRAADAIVVFSNYMRVNIDSLKIDGVIPFSDEMRHIENYMRIERMRFGDTLRLDEALSETDFSVPPLSIQPLVENAVRHGIRGRYGNGTVLVSTRLDGDDIVLTVEDNGVGMPEGEVTERALASVRARLNDALGATLEIKSKPGEGTCVTVRFAKPTACNGQSGVPEKSLSKKHCKTQPV